MERNVIVTKAIVSKIWNRELDMSSVAEKCISRSWTEDYKTVVVLKSLIRIWKSNGNVKRKKGVADDERWVRLYDPGTKVQSSQRKKPEYIYI